MHRNKFSDKLLAVLLVITMIIPLFTASGTVFAGAPTEVIIGTDGPEDANIAPEGTVTFSTTTSQGNIANINAASAPSTSYSPGSTWNSWGSAHGTAATPFYVTLRWDEVRDLDSMRIMWWVYTDGGVIWPTSCDLEYLNSDDEWVNYGSVGLEQNGSAPDAGSANYVVNTIWNDVEFPSRLTTKAIRLKVVNRSSASSGAGFGINRWQVSGRRSLAVLDMIELNNINFNNMVSDVSLPTTGSNGSTITWSSSNQAALANDGTVTRPGLGSLDVTGTITAVVENAEDGTSATATFDFSVFPIKSDAETIAHDLEVLDLGDLSSVVSSIDLPEKGVWGSTLTWDSDNTSYLWTDGTVLRPPLGESDAVVALTVTSESGGESGSREFTVTIPAFEESKTIVSAETPEIDSPAGTVPKLPNEVKVTYNNGKTEKRKVRWANDADAAQKAQMGYLVGHQYTVSGNVSGDTIGKNGFEVKANVTVVTESDPVPDQEPVANTLSLSSVTLDGTNRLTQNQTGSLTMLKNVDVEQMLYNYRDTFGVSTQGAETPDGWDQTTCKLKGHGVGHYMSAMALAYESTGDETLLDNMTYMVNELRKLQEMTFVEKTTGGGYFEAKDIAPSDNEVTNMNGYMANWGKDPTKFGYGYINAVSPEHPILVERYAAYSDQGNGVWAPYYSIHKQLAGLIDIYNATGNEKALQIAEDMGLWIYNRLHNRTWWGSESDRSRPGNRTAMWNLYIAGEYGGVNESLARLYDLTGDERLLEAASYFDNKTYFDPLAVNNDSIRGRHANQHIPQITGALWLYKGSGDENYYNMAENFWNYNYGRYAYSIGGVGTGEMYRQPYTQALNIAGSNCETCCAYNLLKLTKDLNGYNPDDAKYMDYYERLLYNQVVGSVSAGSTANAVTYHYPVQANGSKGFDYSGTIPSTCCTGTGSENHVKYQEATYFTSADNSTFYVGLYMPTTATWEEKGVKINQDCLFPAESSTIRLTEGTGTFEMKLRVPYWATEDFDITLNGTSIADNFEPGTYVSTGTRTWTTSDILVVTMPFAAHIDYTPDKLEGNNVGSIMYGPLVMTTTGESDWTSLQIDTYLEDESLIKLDGASDVTGTTNLYSMTLRDKTFRPHYYATRDFNTYFYIDLQGAANSEYKTPLYDLLLEANGYELDDTYTEVTLEALQDAISEAVDVYQSNNASREDISAAIQTLSDALDGLISTGSKDTTVLEAALDTARAVTEDDYTWDSFAALTDEITRAGEVLANPNSQVAIDRAAKALDKAVDDLVLATSVNKEALAEALDLAREKTQSDWTVKSWTRLQDAVSAGQSVYNNEMRNASQQDVDDAVDALNLAINKLHPYFLCDDTEELEALLTEAKACKVSNYTSETYADLLVAIEYADGILRYCQDGSGTWDQAEKAMSDLREAMDGLIIFYRREMTNLARKITYTGSGNNLTFTNGAITVSGTLNSWNSLAAVNDDFIPAISQCANNQAWATWGGNYTMPIWIEYDFGKKYEISSTSVFWNDNDESGTGGDGGIKVPKGWTLEYMDYSSATPVWKSVTLLPGEKFGTEIDVMNEVWFNTVVTDKVRITISEANTPTVQGGGSGAGRPGICEWQVWGPERGAQSVIEAAQGLDANKYTEESFARVLEALIDVALVNQGNQSAVNVAIQALEEAIDRLEDKPEAPVINLTDLNNVIADARGLDAGRYTAATYQAVIDALADAITADKSSQEAVDAATLALENAIADLVGVSTANLDDLNEIIEEAKGLDAGRYTTATYQAVINALADAITADKNNQTEVDAAEDALRAAIAGLVDKPVVPPVDLNGFNTAVNNAKDLNAERYTDISYGRVITALINAAAVDKSNQTAVDEAAAALEEAISQLEDKTDTPVDLTKLNEAAAAAKALKADKYTSASYEKVLTALAEMAAVDRESQTAVDAAVAALEKAIQDLELKGEDKTADLTKLNAAVAAAKALKAELYTPASYAKVAEQLANTISVDMKDQKAVDQAANALTSAINSLKKVTPVITLKAPVIKKAKSSSKGKISITLKKKVANAAGYEIRVSTKKNKSYKLSLTLQGASKLKGTAKKNIKSGKTYYVKARAYRMEAGKKKYGPYSAWRRVKVK